MSIRSDLDAISKAKLKVIENDENPVIFCNGSFWLECEKGDKAFTIPVSRTGNWEAWVAAAIDKTIFDLLDKSPVFIDVGANVGYYSALAGQYNIKVLSIEPNKSLLPYLYRNLFVHNKTNSTILNYAISDKEGTTLLEIPGDHSGGAHLTTVVSNSTTEVDLTKLDNLFKEPSTPVIIKVDVEGYEMDVWHSAEEIRKRVPTIWFMEWVPGRWSKELMINFLNEVELTHDIAIVDYSGKIKEISKEVAMELTFDTLVLRSRE